MARTTTTNEEILDDSTSGTSMNENVAVPKKSFNKTAAGGCSVGFFCVCFLIKFILKLVASDALAGPTYPYSYNDTLIKVQEAPHVNLMPRRLEHLDVIQGNISKLPIVMRNEWNAKPRGARLTVLGLPVRKVIISDTESQNCYTKEECALRMRLIQIFDKILQKFYDIGNNFVIGGDGRIYEGRGWDFHGMPANDLSYGSIGIAFIGNFTKQPPQKLQFDALNSLLEEGVRLEKLSKYYKLYPLSAFFLIESPGEKLLEAIKVSPHYSEYI